MFQVPPSKASVNQDKFEFELEGKKYGVKRFDCLTVEEQLKLTSDDISEQEALDIVWGKASTKLGAIVRNLEAHQFDALKTAWIEDSGVTPGESDGSSES